MSVEQIQGDGTLESTFKRAMNYLAEQVDKKKQMQAKIRSSPRQISAVSTGGSASKAKEEKKERVERKGNSKAKERLLIFHTKSGLSFRKKNRKKCAKHVRMSKQRRTSVSNGNCSNRNLRNFPKGTDEGFNRNSVSGIIN